MLCPFCQKKIPDAVVRSEGARLMNAARTQKSRDPELMRRLGRLGGKKPKKRKSKATQLDEARAEIRRLSEQLAKERFE